MSHRTSHLSALERGLNVRNAASRKFALIGTVAIWEQWRHHGTQDSNDRIHGNWRHIMSDTKTTKVLRLNLKREYWEAIRDEEKRCEYRLANAYWKKRLEKRDYKEVHLCLGYPKTGDESRVLKRKWFAPPQIEITHKHFGERPVIVYAIKVSEAASGFSIF